MGLPPPVTGAVIGSLLDTLPPALLSPPPPQAVINAGTVNNKIVFLIRVATSKEKNGALPIGKSPPQSTAVLNPFQAATHVWSSRPDCCYLFIERHAARYVRGIKLFSDRRKIISDKWPRFY